MSLSPTPNWYQRIVLLIKKTMKKKKKKPSPQQSNMIPSLFDDLLLTCFALIPRLYYPTLSLVCKRFRSLIASPELYETRSLLGRTESCLYVCLRFPPDPNTRWYTLCLKPDHTGNKKNKKKKKKKKEDENSSGKLLVPVSIQNSPPFKWSTLVSVGPYIYAISESIRYVSCSKIPFLDCRTHTWLEAPKLRVVHTNSEYDGMLYLPGKCQNPDSLNCVQVFDTKRKNWNPVPPERREMNFTSMEGKMILYEATGKHSGLAFNPKESTDEFLGSNTGYDLFWCCIIQSISYCYTDCGEFVWLEDSVRRKVRGLEGLPEISANYKNVKLARHGGNMLLLWDELVGKKEKMVWCAEISFERHSTEEIWGKVVWFDAVLTVPKSYVFMYALSATL